MCGDLRAGAVAYAFTALNRQLKWAWYRWSPPGGAEAEMRRTRGTAVFAGMLGVTLFGIFLTPVFYYVIRRLSGPFKPTPAPKSPAATEKPDGKEDHSSKEPGP